MSDKNKNTPKNEAPLEKTKDPKNQAPADNKDAKDKLVQSDVNKAEGKDREELDDQQLQGHGPLLNKDKVKIKIEPPAKKEVGKKEPVGEKEVVDATLKEEAKTEAEVSVVEGGGGLEGPASINTNLERVPLTKKPLQLSAGLPPVATLPSLQVNATADPNQVASASLVKGIASDIDNGRYDLKSHIISLNADMETAAIEQTAKMTAVASEQTFAIQVAALDASTAVANSFIKQKTAAKLVIANEKIVAGLDIDSKVNKQREQLLDQKRRIAALSGTLADSVGAKFDGLAKQMKDAAEAAITAAHGSAKTKQAALQIATADKAPNDYEKRKNKAAGDAAVLAAQDAEAAIAKTLEENLASLPTHRASWVDAAKKSVAEMEERINSELVRVETAGSGAKTALQAGLDTLEGDFVKECETMSKNAQGQLGIEAEELIKQLDAGVKAYQEAIDTSLTTAKAQLADSVDWADQQFSGLSDRFAEWTQLVDKAEQGSLQTFKSNLASAQNQTKMQFSDHVLIIVASIVRETQSGIDMLRENGAQASGALRQTGATLAGGIPQLTDGLASAATTIAAEALTPLSNILAETGPAVASIETDLSALENSLQIIDELTSQRAQEFKTGVTDISTKLLDAETSTAIATAQSKVIKKPGRWTWARVATAVVSVVASAFTIAGLSLLGLSAATTMLVSGVAFMAIGQVKQSVQALMAGEKLTLSQRGKAAFLSFSTGILASMGGLMMAAAPIKGVLSIVNLSPIFVLMKSFFSQMAESLVGTIAVRATLGMLPTKISELIQWLRSGSPEKKKKNPLMLGGDEEMEQLSLEERIDKSVAKDNTEAIKNGKLQPGSGMVATTGHIIKGVIGG